MKTETAIMGLFRDDGQAARAIAELASSGFRFLRAYSPIPSHKITAVLRPKKSPVGWFTLTGGILGFFSGFALAIFAATRWDLIAGGKPVISLVPFVIVGFELTVLFAVFGNVIGLLTCTRLPNYKGLQSYDPRCSGEHFGVLAACESGRQDELADFFRKKGGETRVFA